MRKLFAALALCSLAACSATGVTSSPSTIANSTTLDEKAGVTAEALYVASSKVGAALVTAGKLTPAQYRALDNTAYTALLATRAAYAAGNATDYATAAAEVTAAAYAIISLVK